MPYDLQDFDESLLFREVGLRQHNLERHPVPLEEGEKTQVAVLEAPTRINQKKHSPQIPEQENDDRLLTRTAQQFLPSMRASMISKCRIIAETFL